MPYAPTRGLWVRIGSCPSHSMSGMNRLRRDDHGLVRRDSDTNGQAVLSHCQKWLAALDDFRNWLQLGLLGRGVDAVCREAFAAYHRRTENDGCAVGQQRQSLLNRKKHAFYVGVENRIEKLFADSAQGGIADNAGIRKHNIELALLLLDLSKEAFDVGDVRHVSLHTGDISSDFLDGGGQFRAAAPSDEDVGAFVDKLLRGREADAAIDARHERDFSVKLAHRFRLDVRFISPLTSPV